MTKRLSLIEQARAKLRKEQGIDEPGTNPWYSPTLAKLRELNGARVARVYEIAEDMQRDDITMARETCIIAALKREEEEFNDNQKKGILQQPLPDIEPREDLEWIHK